MERIRKTLAGLLAIALLMSITPLSTVAAEADEHLAVPEIIGIDAQIGEDHVAAVPAEPVGKGDAELLSLLPLEIKYYTLDLRGYLQDELKTASLQTVIEGLAPSYSSEQAAEADSSKYAVWAKWYYYDENGEYISRNDDYEILGETVDLSSGDEYSSNYTIELIVGTCDQLNPSNIRYRVEVRTSGMNNLLDFQMTTVTGEPITIYQDSIYYNDGKYEDDGHCHYQIGVKPSEYVPGDAMLTLGFANAAWKNRNFSVSVYEGYYEDAAQLPAADSAKNITEKIWRDNTVAVDGYRANYNYNNWPEFTLVLAVDGGATYLVPFGIYTYSDEIEVYFDALYKKDGPSFSSAEWSYDYNWGDVVGYGITLQPGNSLTDTYYVRLYVSDPEREYRDQMASIQGAYVGKLTKAQVEEKAPGGADDIKTFLFSQDYTYQDGGYAVDFSQYRNGITFTVLDRVGDIHYLCVQLVGVRPSAPQDAAVSDPLSDDIYFRAMGAQDAGIQSYTMSYEDDSYYYNGYQTVFLLTDGGPITAKEITPEFYTGNGAKIFSNGNPGDTDTAGAVQISGETTVNFLSGEGLRYTATAENGEDLKNYWVTFVTQQDKPALFVNGTNDTTNYQEDLSVPESASKIPARVIYLTKAYNYHHDIFFANLGAEALDHLSVSLTGPDGTGEAVGVELDPYWTIGETKTLAGFTTTHNPANIGKIRLQPKRDTTTGEIISSYIDGLLTIGAGSGETRQEVKIRLTGVAGEFKITTQKLWDGVRHVSYSSLLQTNYMTSGDANISFKLTSGRLPSGLSLLKNGELYGIPTTTGTYTFTITATCEENILGQSNTWTDSKTYTVEIADNADSAAVWNYEASVFGDDAYKILIAIPNEDNEDNIGEGATKGENSWDNETMLLHSSGEYETFLDKVFLDSRQLTPGVDYTSEAGSTRLVIKTQTLTNTTRGNHTLTVESRVGDKETGTLHRVAQNYNLSTRGRTTSSSGSGSSGSAVQTYALTVAPTANGTVNASITRATAGAQVTLTVTPDAGYILDVINVVGANSVAISPTAGAEGTYTFSMPDCAVTVTVSFKLQVQNLDGDSSHLFVDVPAEAWYASAVDYVAQAGLMIGSSEKAFLPEVQTSRAMLAAVLYRMEGAPVQEDNAFADVQAGMWYTAAMAWANEVGVLAGYGDGRLGPDDTLTREQVAEIFFHYAQLKGYDTSVQGDLSLYSDAEVASDFALESLTWANGAGLIVGGGNNKLDPKVPASRAQIAQILMNFQEKVALVDVDN